MSEKVKVRIEMDQVFWWGPISAEQIAERSELVGTPKECQPPVTMEIDKSLFNQCELLRVEYYALQEKLEQLFRIQENLTPWTSQPIPDYTKLE